MSVCLHHMFACFHHMFVHVGASAMHACCAREPHSCVCTCICTPLSHIHTCVYLHHVCECASIACLCTQSCFHVYAHVCIPPLHACVPELCMPCVLVSLCASIMLCACLHCMYAPPPSCVCITSIMCAPTHVYVCASITCAYLMCMFLHPCTYRSLCMFVPAFHTCLHVCLPPSSMCMCAYVCTCM